MSHALTAEDLFSDEAHANDRADEILFASDQQRIPG